MNAIVLFLFPSFAIVYTCMQRVCLHFRFGCFRLCVRVPIHFVCLRTSDDKVPQPQLAQKCTHIRTHQVENSFGWANANACYGMLAFNATKTNGKHLINALRKNHTSQTVFCRKVNIKANNTISNVTHKHYPAECIAAQRNICHCQPKRGWCRMKIDSDAFWNVAAKIAKPNSQIMEMLLCK